MGWKQPIGYLFKTGIQVYRDNISIAGESIMGLVSKTIGTCLHERAAATPDLQGVGYRDYWYSWKDADEISDFLAVRYLKMGIGKGSHAAIWSVNSPNLVFCFFALNKIGAVSIMINTCYKEKEMEDILRDNDIEYLFYGYGCKHVCYQDVLDRVPLNELPKFRKAMELEEDPQDKWYQRKNYPAVLSPEDRALLTEAESRVKPEDTACILFTSGTTSKPKGVMLSHYSLINNSAEIARKMHWNSSDKICVSVPMFHCFGITAGILACINSGASAHLLKYYKTVEVLSQIQKYKCTILNGVPTMYLAMLRNKFRPEYDISSLNSGVIAGSPILPAEYMEICRELELPHLQVSYGQTESSPCVTISAYEDTLERKSVTSGAVIDDIELEICDNATGKVLEAGQTGEIITRGYHVMQGYYKRPEETIKAIDENGWLHTGDLGYLDEDGYLHVTGRIKDMIIRGGENISPAEIENCIISMPEVSEVKVVGIPAEVLQEEIVACVIPKEGMTLDEEKVTAYVKERLSDYKVPKYVLTFQEFPINASGKVLTKDLKQQVADRLKVK